MVPALFDISRPLPPSGRPGFSVPSLWGFWPRLGERGHRATELCRQMLDYARPGAFLAKPFVHRELMQALESILEMSEERRLA